jgi:hypothetical protein
VAPEAAISKAILQAKLFVEASSTKWMIPVSNDSHRDKMHHRVVYDSPSQREIGDGLFPCCLHESLTQEQRLLKIAFRALFS